MLINKLYKLLAETREYAKKNKYLYFGENNEYKIETFFLIGCISEQIEELHEEEKNGTNKRREETWYRWSY